MLLIRRDVHVVVESAAAGRAEPKVKGKIRRLKLEMEGLEDDGTLTSVLTKLPPYSDTEPS
jgi:hypothetical protein